MKQFLRLMLIAFGLAGCASRVDPIWVPTPAQASLVDLTVERLEVAREVAWYKYFNGVPVKDSRREKSTLRDLVARGKVRGLAPSTVSRYFRAQMAASRMYQTDMIRGWQAGQPTPAKPPMSLEGRLRARIDTLNVRILDQLAAAGPSARSRALQERARTYLIAREIPEDVIRKSIAPLR